MKKRLTLNVLSILLATNLLISCHKQINPEIPSSVSIKNGLVAYYPFCNNLIDSSGNGHNGTAGGNISFVPNHLGKTNSALALGAGRVTTDKFFAFQKTDSFTVSLWFTMSSTLSSGRLISTECSEGNFRIARYNSGVYAFQFGGFYLYDTVTFDSWNHLVYIYKNRNYQLFKNGKLKNSGFDNDMENLNYCTPFTIGAKASPAYDTWQGSIDNIRIYNRVLSNGEVRYLFEN